MPFPALAAAFHRFLEELQVFLHQSTRTLYKVFAGDSSFSLLFDALKYVFFFNSRIQPRNTTNTFDSIELFLLGAGNLTMSANGVLMANK